MKQKKDHSNVASCLTNEEKNFLADREWALNDPAICQKHAGKVIAVCDKKLIAAASTITDLRKKIERLKKDDPRRSRLVVVSSPPIVP